MAIVIFGKSVVDSYIQSPISRQYGYDYLEIFGLTDDEWIELAKEKYVDPTSGYGYIVFGKKDGREMFSWRKW